MCCFQAACPEGGGEGAVALCEAAGAGVEALLRAMEAAAATAGAGAGAAEQELDRIRRMMSSCPLTCLEPRPCLLETRARA